MGTPLSRREFLALGLLLARPARGRAEEALRRLSSYEIQIGVLFDLLTYTITGRVVEEVDRAAGRYRVAITGEGTGVTGQVDTSGTIRDGRFLPARTRSAHTVRGRENWVEIAYDHDRGVAEYRSVTHTFFLGRRRQVHDLVRFPPAEPVDDLVSAVLNFAAGALEAGPDGSYGITLVRRTRPADEGPDDVSPDGYRAELLRLRFRPSRTETGRLTALVDLTGFSSWARANQPAQVTFGPDRHLESVRSALILGTSFTLRRAPLS
jgi:hypothetical protein